MIPFYIGTYTDGTSRGIYRLQLDPVAARLSTPVLAVEAVNPSFLGWHPSRRVVYSVGEIHDAAAATPGALFAYAALDDGRLEVKFSVPGTPGAGTNPEQMFAAGWSACFEGAMGIIARRMKIELPAETSIDAEVDLCLDKGNYFIAARLNISLPGLDREKAQALVDASERTCPYSKAIKGNVDVKINLV